MNDERNNSAPVETADVRDDQPLSIEDAASRLSDTLGDEPEAKDPPATEAEPVEAKSEQDPKPDDDDWDSPVAEDDAEGQSEASEAEGEAKDQPSEQGRFVGLDAKVRLDDGRVVTVAELRAGSMMQQDYTRKTQELAEQRRSVEARQAEYEQEAQQFAFQRELVGRLASQVVPAAPDPEMMQTDPVGYMQAKERHEAFMGQLQQLAYGQMQEQEQRNHQAQQAFHAHCLQEAESLMKAMPELKDPAKRAKWSAELERTAAHYGFENSDIGNVKDHRLFVLITDAMRYRRIVENRAQSAEKTKGKPPATIEPGRRQSTQANAARDREQLRARVRQTGSVEDAARALGSLDL